MKRTLILIFTLFFLIFTDSGFSQDDFDDFDDFDSMEKKEKKPQEEKKQDLDDINSEETLEKPSFDKEPEKKKEPQDFDEFEEPFEATPSAVKKDKMPSYSSSKNISSDYTILKIAVLPFIDQTKVKLAEELQSLTIQIFQQFYGRFVLIPYFQIQNLVKEKKLFSEQELRVSLLGEVARKNNIDLFIVGTVVELESNYKILFRFLLGKTEGELKSEIIELPKHFTNDMLVSDLEQMIKNFDKKIPYQGIVIDATDRDKIKVRTGRLTKIRKHHNLSIVKISGVSKHPIQKYITDFEVDEISALSVVDIKGDYLFVKQTDSRSEAKEGDLVKITTTEEVESLINDTYKKNEPSEIETLKPREKEFEKEEDIEYEKIEPQTVSHRKDTNVYFGIQGNFMPLFDYNLAKDGNAKVAHFKLVNFMGGGAYFNFEVSRFFAFDLDFRHTLRSYDVDVPKHGKIKALQIHTNNLNTNLKLRLVLGSSEIVPELFLRAGFHYFSFLLGKVLIEQDATGTGQFKPKETGYLIPEKIYSPTAGLEFKIPFGTKYFGLKAYGDYWVFPFYKEDPLNSTGQKPKPFAFDFGGGLFINAGSLITFEPFYFGTYVKTKFSGTGRRFLQDINNGNISELSHMAGLKFLFHF